MSSYHVSARIQEANMVHSGLALPPLLRGDSTATSVMAALAVLLPAAALPVLDAAPVTTLPERMTAGSVIAIETTTATAVTPVIVLAALIGELPYPCVKSSVWYADLEPCSERDRDVKEDRDREDRDRRENGTNGDDRKGTSSCWFYMATLYLTVQQPWTALNVPPTTISILPSKGVDSRLQLM